MHSRDLAPQGAVDPAGEVVVGRKRVTLADVARAAGVSPTTASLVLSGRGRELRISEIVQQRVRAVSDELGYRPNIVSIALSKGTTRTLGFVSDTVATSQLAGDLIKGALDAARRHGYMLFIAESEGDPAAEQQLLDAMLDRQVDGVVLASMFTRLRRTPDALADVPSVLLNTLPLEPGRVPAVVPDEHEAGRAAARLLLDAGHRRIHLIGAGPDVHSVPAGTVAGRERLAGICEVLADVGLEPASGHVLEDWTPLHGRQAVAELLGTTPDVGALLCFNDRVAFGAYQALQAAGRRVPDDVSVVSFDDAPLAQWLEPGLTTFAIPHEQLGGRAVELLLQLVDASRRGAAPGGATAHAGVHRLPMPLRRRGSVAPRATAPPRTAAPAQGRPDAGRSSC